jgi:hypothetical protein
MELGWSLPKRKDLIQRLKGEPATPSHPVYFQDQRLDLPVRRVPIGFPKYRLDNGRTRSAQVEWLATHPDAPKTLFTADLESEAAQHAQHEILKIMLGTGTTELRRYFRTHDQSEPLILTEHGFVLNGNRRLCAMRELIREETEKFSAKFGNISAVFLPPADDLELDRLEARLQIAKDIKEEYSWTAKAFMLRTRRDEHGFSQKDLSALYEMPPSEVELLLDMLSLADAYLEDREKSGQFKLVDGAEFAFRQLTKNREGLKTESDKELFTQLSYCLIDEGREGRRGKGRVYAAIPDVAKYLDSIREAIRGELADDAPVTESKGAAVLGVKTVKLDPVIAIVEDEKQMDAVRSLMSDTIETEKFYEQEHKRGNQAAAALTKASELIQIALRAWKTAKSKQKVADNVIKLEDLVKQLRTKVDAETKH